MEILIAALIFYFVIKHAVRNAIIEAKVKEKELSLQVRINDLIEKITIIGHGVINSTKSKELKHKAKEINDDCFKISISNVSDEDKFAQLKYKENEMVMLKSTESVYE